MKTKIFTLLFAIVASLGITEATVYNGTCGENLTWTLNTEDSTLVIEGSGDMAGNFIPYNYKRYIKTVTISDSVTSIGYHAFASCSSLTSVTIPDSVTSIGYGAFAWCDILASVIIPNSVTSIGNDAFHDCSSLTSVTIPNSVTSIGNGAFAWCDSLASVTIGNSVTSIGDSAFSYCSSLTSVTIPNGVTSIGGYAFYNCSGLTSIDVASDNPNYSSADGVLFNKDKTTLIQCPEGKQGAYEIPNSVTWIGGMAFSGCSGLTSVTIPNSVTSIGYYAFARCDSLASVIIPNSVTSISDYAFYGCSSLTSVTIPNSVTSIRAWAFAGCSGLTDIYTSCGDLGRIKQLLNNDSRVKYTPLPYSITVHATNGEVSYPQNMCDALVLTATPNFGYHFARWSDGSTDNPRTIELTQDTTFTAEFVYDRIGYCGKDMALVWSYDPINKVLTINNTGEFTENMQYGVEAPKEMMELVIGNNVTAIGANAFAGISTLTKLTLGESVKTIGSNAFYDCVNLETIYNYRATPTNAYSTSFDGVDKFACTLYVLPNSIDMYKAASVWRDFYYTYAIGADVVTEQITDVAVVPANNTAVVTWPVADQAATYTLQITKDEVVFCTLIFNSNGQLTGIAFAPSRDGKSRTPAAIMTANGMQFTVTGLNSGTNYAFSLTAKDAQNTVVASYTGQFTTTGAAPVATDITNVQSNEVQCTKVIRDGQIYLMYNGQMYNVLGAKVK